MSNIERNQAAKRRRKEGEEVAREKERKLRAYKQWLNGAANFAGPIGQVVKECLAFSANAITTLEGAKANELASTLLKKRVSSLQSMLKSIESILRMARRDAPVHGSLKLALISALAALQSAAMAAKGWGLKPTGMLACFLGANIIQGELALMNQQLDSAIHDLNGVMTVCIFLNQQDAPARSMEMMEEELAKSLLAEMALFGQLLTSIEDKLDMLVDGYSKGLISRQDANTRKLISKQLEINTEVMFVASDKATQKAKKWMADNLTLMPSEVVISFDQPLGEGGFAKLYKASYKGLEVAVKVSHRTGPTSEQDMLDLGKEAYILAQLRSRHVVEILGVVSLLPTATFGIVMKFYPQSLDNLMRTTEFELLSMSAKMSMSLQLAKGLLSLHDHPNVLVEPSDGGWVCAISDFGSATVGLSSTTAAFGTPNTCTWRYAAPEVMDGKKKRRPADMYSLGLIIAQIFTGEAPYHEETSDDRVRDFVKLRVPPMNLGSHDDDVIPIDIHNLVLSCLAEKPGMRPSIHQIVELLAATAREAAAREVADREAATVKAGVREAADRETVAREAANRDAAAREAATRAAADREAADREVAARAAADRAAADRAAADRVAAIRAAADREAATRESATREAATRAAADREAANKEAARREAADREAATLTVYCVN
eukprot:gene6264-2892_t